MVIDYQKYILKSR